MVPVAAVFVPRAFNSFKELYERRALLTDMLGHTQKYIIILIITELVLVIIELVTGHGAMERLLSGPTSLIFYAYLLLGIIIPLGISYYVGKLKTSGKDGSVLYFSIGSYILILVGGFLLRYIILTAGQIFF
jgi:formate-dependent nitrite reductase membrane component NrfD